MPDWDRGMGPHVRRTDIGDYRPNGSLEEAVYEEAQLAVKPSVLRDRGRKPGSNRGVADNRVGADREIQDVVTRRRVSDSDAVGLNARRGIEPARVMGFHDRRQAGKLLARIAVQPVASHRVHEDQRLIIKVSGGSHAGSKRIDGDGIAVGSDVELHEGLGEPTIVRRNEQSHVGKQVRRVIVDLQELWVAASTDSDTRCCWNRDVHSHAQGPGLLAQEKCLDNELDVAELPCHAERRIIRVENVVGFQIAHGKSHFHRHAPVEKRFFKTGDEAIGVRRRRQLGVVKVAVVTEHAVRRQGAVVVRKSLGPQNAATGAGNWEDCQS